MDSETQDRGNEQVHLQREDWRVWKDDILRVFGSTLVPFLSVWPGRITRTRMCLSASAAEKVQTFSLTLFQIGLLLYNNTRCPWLPAWSDWDRGTEGAEGSRVPSDAKGGKVDRLLTPLLTVWVTLEQTDRCECWLEKRADLLERALWSW